MAATATTAVDDEQPASIYPRLLRRVRAVIIDEVILLGMLAAWWFGLGIDPGMHLAAKLGSLLLVFVVVDPVLVAFTGGTVGHHLMGMKVRELARDARAGLGMATVRAVFRYGLGWASLIFILVTRRHQAIHDYASRTLVVLKDPARVPGTERLPERGDQAI